MYGFYRRERHPNALITNKMERRHGSTVYSAQRTAYKGPFSHRLDLVQMCKSVPHIGIVRGTLSSFGSVGFASSTCLDIQRKDVRERGRNALAACHGREISTNHHMFIPHLPRIPFRAPSSTNQHVSALSACSRLVVAGPSIAP